MHAYQLKLDTHTRTNFFMSVTLFLIFKLHLHSICIMKANNMMKTSVSSEQITTASNPSFTAHEQNVATIVYQPLLGYTVDMVLVRMLLM